jgi:hypothetical protein
LFHPAAISGWRQACLLLQIGRFNANREIGNFGRPLLTQNRWTTLPSRRYCRHCSDVIFVRGACVSFQVTVLKVLAGHPGGTLSVADLKHAVAVLMTSGRDWTDRTKRMLARAPDLDIFSQSLVIRDADGWRITDAGLALLATIERPVSADAREDEAKQEAVSEQPPYATSAPMPNFSVGRRRRSRRRRKPAGARRTAA